MEMVPIILACVFVVLALAYRITFGLRKGPDQTRKTQIVMLYLLGSGLLLVGATMTYEIAASNRVVKEGVVASLRQTTGKGSHSIFSVVPIEDKIVQVNANYKGSRLFNGETVRVRYFDRTGDITSLEVRNGPNIGWSETESGGVFQAFFCVGIGLVLLSLGIKVKIKGAAL